MVTWFDRNPTQKFLMVEVPLKDLKVASTCGWLAACATSQSGRPHLTPLQIPKGRNKVIAVLKRPADGASHPIMVVLDGFEHREDLACLTHDAPDRDQICQGIWDVFEIAELTRQRPIELINMALSATAANKT